MAWSQQARMAAQLARSRTHTGQKTKTDMRVVAEVSRYKFGKVVPKGTAYRNVVAGLLRKGRSDYGPGHFSNPLTRSSTFRKFFTKP